MQVSRSMARAWRNSPKLRICTPLDGPAFDRPRRLPSFAAIAGVAGALAAGLIREDLQAQLALARVGEQPPSSTPTQLLVRTRRATPTRSCASFSSARKQKPYSAESSADAARPPRFVRFLQADAADPSQRDSPQTTSPPRRSDRGCPSSCIRTAGVIDRREPGRPGSSYAQIQASASRARHDCFCAPAGSRRAIAKATDHSPAIADAHDRSATHSAVLWSAPGFEDT